MVNETIIKLTKIFFKILIKIVGTPFVVLFFVFFYLANLAAQFFEWVYESSDYDKQITREIKASATSDFTKWFTKL
jgi:hypothetical protein